MDATKAERELDLFYSQIDAIQKRSDSVLKAGSFVSSSALEGLKGMVTGIGDLIGDLTSSGKAYAKGHIENLKTLKTALEKKINQFKDSVTSAGRRK